MPRRGADATEKRLRAEINALKQENANLKDTNQELKAHSDGVAIKMVEWHALAQKAKERMEAAICATKDLSVLSDISPESQDAAVEAILRAREKQVIPDSSFWSMEDHLVAIMERVNHMGILGSDLPLAAIAAFRALWPGKEVPKKVSELCEWVRAAEPRLCEWRDSAGRIGLFKGLQVILSWYDGIDLDSLRSIHANSPFYTNVAAKKMLEKKACELLDYADVHSQFFKDVNEAEESDEDDAGDAGNDVEGERTEENPDELLISDVHRQSTPASDPAGPTPN